MAKFKAAILSFLIAGLGQAYYSKKWMAWVKFLIVAIILSVVTLGFGAFFIWLWAVVDAYLMGKAMEEGTYHKSLVFFGEVNPGKAPPKEAKA